jgi:hypothetical protein
VYRIEIEGGAEARLTAIRSRHRKLAYRVGGELRSPSKASEFAPEFPPILWNEDPTRYDTVVAAYVPPEAVLGGLKRASAEFELGDLARIAGRAQVLVSVPAIRSNGTPVRIERIMVEYRRESFSLANLWRVVLRSLNPSILTL